MNLFFKFLFIQLTLAHSVQFGGEFEVLVFGAEDFLENSGKLSKQNKEAPTQSNDKCKTQ